MINLFDKKIKNHIDKLIYVCFNVYIEAYKGACIEMQKGSQAYRAYKSIQAGIFDGTLFRGYPISEVELAEKLEMSRTPIREAVTRLRSEGLLEYIPRKGFVVRQFNKSDICKAYEYTEAVEGKMVSLLAERAGEIDLTEARTCINGMETTLEAGDIDGWLQYDEAFHNALRDLCDNHFIVNALNSVYGQIYYTRMLVTRVMLDKQLSTREHRQTLQYIEQGNAEGARECTERHASRIRKEVQRLL